MSAKYIDLLISNDDLTPAYEKGLHDFAQALFVCLNQARPDSLSISSGSRVAPLSAERAKAA